MSNDFACIPNVDSDDLAEHLEDCFHSGRVPLVYGAPGVGKSTIFRDYAAKHGRVLLDVRLTYKLPEHLGAMLVPNAARDAVAALKPQLIAQVEALKASSGKPVLVLFDELTLAGQETLSASLEFLLDRRIDGHAIPADTWVAAAGNRPQDTASAVTLDPPVRSRVASVVYQPTNRDTARYFETAIPASQLRNIAIAFLESSQAKPVTSGAPGNEAAFYTPRGLESAIAMCARHVAKADDIAKNKRVRRAFESCLGKPFFAAFSSYAVIAASMKAPADVLAAPDTADIPDVTAAVLAQLGALMSYIAGHPDGKPRDGLVAAMFDYVDRCSPEDVRIWASSLPVEQRTICTKTIRGKRLFSDVMAGNVAGAAGIAAAAKR